MHDSTDIGGDCSVDGVVDEDGMTGRVFYALRKLVFKAKQYQRRTHDGASCIEKKANVEVPVGTRVDSAITRITEGQLGGQDGFFHKAEHVLRVSLYLLEKKGHFSHGGGNSALCKCAPAASSSFSPLLTSFLLLSLLLPLPCLSCPCLSLLLLFSSPVQFPPPLTSAAPALPELPLPEPPPPLSTAAVRNCSRCLLPPWHLLLPYLLPPAPAAPAAGPPEVLPLRHAVLLLVAATTPAPQATCGCLHPPLLHLAWLKVCRSRICHNCTCLLLLFFLRWVYPFKGCSAQVSPARSYGDSPLLPCQHGTPSRCYCSDDEDKGGGFSTPATSAANPATTPPTPPPPPPPPPPPFPPTPKHLPWQGAAEKRVGSGLEWAGVLVAIAGPGAGDRRWRRRRR
ncbi:unnamed protein product [Closterium sp. NIES-53]